MYNLIDLTGQRFGRLVVICRSTRKCKGSTYWNCQCDCGKMMEVTSNDLRKLKTVSCGCYAREMTINRSTTHGLRSHRLYNVWIGFLGRCYCTTSKAYKHYGGRGITVCDKWRDDFQLFYKWAVNNGYKQGLSIDRIDNNGNYTPENCRWATSKQQNRNTRKNPKLTYKEESKTLSEWCDVLGLKYKTIQTRIGLGWQLQDAFERPRYFRKANKDIQSIAQGIVTRRRPLKEAYFPARTT